MTLNCYNILNQIDENYFVLNLFEEFMILKNNDSKTFSRFFTDRFGHYSIEGNKFVANLINEKVKKISDL